MATLAVKSTMTDGLVREYLIQRGYSATAAAFAKEEAACITHQDAECKNDGPSNDGRTTETVQLEVSGESVNTHREKPLVVAFQWPKGVDAKEDDVEPLRRRHAAPTTPEPIPAHEPATLAPKAAPQWRAPNENRSFLWQSLLGMLLIVGLTLWWSGIAGAGIAQISNATSQFLTPNPATEESAVLTPATVAEPIAAITTTIEQALPSPATVAPPSLPPPPLPPGLESSSQSGDNWVHFEIVRLKNGETLQAINLVVDGDTRLLWGNGATSALGNLLDFAVRSNSFSFRRNAVVVQAVWSAATSASASTYHVQVLLQDPAQPDLLSLVSLVPTPTLPTATTTA